MATLTNNEIPLWTANPNYSSGITTAIGTADLSGYLKNQYASALEAELAGIENAYKQSTATMDRTAQAIPKEYETQRNTVAATNALEKQAFDERANAMGLNTGTSGQAQLARSSMYQRDLAGLNAAEANALADLALQRSNRQAEYEMALVQAKAENDAALNAALYAEMVRQINAAPKYSGGGGSYRSSGGGTGGSGGGYDNGNLTSAQVKALQKEINSYRPADQQIAVDGKWGAETSAAVGGATANQYYAAALPTIHDKNITSSTSAYWTR